MTDMSEYRRLADEYGAASALDATDCEDDQCPACRARKALDAYVERLHATIEAEREVLRGQTVLDSDHAREALAALDELPHLRAELAADAERLDWLEARMTTFRPRGSGTTNYGAAFDAPNGLDLRAAIDAARQEAAT
jgi:hypothetical protein